MVSTSAALDILASELLVLASSSLLQAKFLHREEQAGLMEWRLGRPHQVLVVPHLFLMVEPVGTMRKTVPALYASN